MPNQSAEKRLSTHGSVALNTNKWLIRRPALTFNNADAAKKTNVINRHATSTRKPSIAAVWLLPEPQNAQYQIWPQRRVMAIFIVIIIIMISDVLFIFLGKFYTIVRCPMLIVDTTHGQKSQKYTGSSKKRKIVYILYYMCSIWRLPVCYRQIRQQRL